MFDVKMVDMGALVIALGSGVVLGTLYSSGLRLTLRSLVHTRRPALDLTAGLMAHLAIWLTGFDPG